MKLDEAIDMCVTRVDGNEQTSVGVRFDGETIWLGCQTNREARLLRAFLRQAFRDVARRAVEKDRRE